MSDTILELLKFSSKQNSKDFCLLGNYTFQNDLNPH